MWYKVKRIMMRPNGVEKQVRPTFVPRTFTISRTEKSNMSSWWTYSDDAAWLTAGSWDFDDFFWYSAVLLNTSGVETAEMKQSWWVFTGAMTTLGNITSWDNVMIKFPVRWIKMTKSWSTVTLSITEELNKTWYQYYAHSTWTLSNPWTPKNAFYLWAYKAYGNSNGLKSRSWNRPTANQAQGTFCTRAKANGSWYNIIWYYQRMYVNCLYMMKYGNPNSQSVVWQWYTSWSQSVAWGTTDSVRAATYWTTSGYQQIKLFWLENWWGNVWEWVWWAYLNGKILYTQLSWYSWALSGWESTGNTIQSSSWMSSIVWNNKTLFWNNAAVTNNNTYYCDVVYSSNSGILSAGCSWAAGSEGWTFGLNWTNSANGAAAGIGTRLMYLNWLT